MSCVYFTSANQTLLTNQLQAINTDILAAVAVNPEVDFVVLIKLHVFDNVLGELTVIAAVAISVGVKLDRLNQYAVDLKRDRGLAVILVLNEDADVINTLFAIERRAQVAMTTSFVQFCELAVVSVLTVGSFEAALVHVRRFDVVRLTRLERCVALKAITVEIAEDRTGNCSGIWPWRRLIASVKALIVDPAALYVSSRVNCQNSTRIWLAVCLVECEVVLIGVLTLDLDQEVVLAVRIFDPEILLCVDPNV